MRIMLREGMKACGLVPKHPSHKPPSLISTCSNPDSVRTSISTTPSGVESAFARSHLLFTVTLITFPTLQARERGAVRLGALWQVPGCPLTGFSSSLCEAGLPPPFLGVKEMRFREAKQFAPSHTASWWQSLVFGPGAQAVFL